MTLFLWDTDIGRFIAYAENIEDAREVVMRELSSADAARNELEAAIAPEPRVVRDARAFLAWCE